MTRGRLALARVTGRRLSYLRCQGLTLFGRSDGAKGYNMPTSGSPSRQPRITVFTSPSCHWCKVAKRYLDERGLTYREVDVIKDGRGRQEMARMTGQYGVPVIRVGEHAMTGWDKAEFERLLGGNFKRR
jgi:glutaredoxin